MDKKIVIKGLSLATEFSFIVIFFIFLGYFWGKEFSRNLSILGILLGAFLGLGVGIYHLSKRVS